MPNVAIHRTKNCGIAEINGLSFYNDPLKSLFDLEKQLRYGVTWPPAPVGEFKNQVNRSNVDGTNERGVLFPFVTFTGVVGYGEAYLRSHPGQTAVNYGQQFADFIAANDLGPTVTAPARLNWTGSMIQHWLWSPNYDNLFAFLDKNRPAPKVEETDAPEDRDR